ncbi:glutamate--cysteine ligase regulatory subunit [Anopheles cruzii]|uniref:glutamate--cysteine ligase regulatory subunit n=1 Tax=Anopheles cruzii TaxID=68878 RepID=UPI0022EC77BE|nr:glutamate--cysteine ligase regulatory subunit [Anopheles cruzii]
MLSHLLKNEDVIVSTGNVLNVSDLRKKAGQKPTDELTDCLRSTFGDAEVVEQKHQHRRLVVRRNNDLLEKVGEHPRKDIKIGAKIFLTCFSESALTEAVEKLFEVLEVSYLDNLILACHPPAVSTTNGTGSGERPEDDGDSKEEGVLEWAVGSDNAVGNLQNLWGLLERYSGLGKIGQLGIADLDADSLQKLYEGATVRPTIAQINLAACCVVPPELQAYCNQNEIQLLTHSDPQELLPRDVLNELELDNYGVAWSLRYQVHIKCRGVLAAKGFIVSLDRSN